MSIIRAFFLRGGGSCTQATVQELSLRVTRTVGADSARQWGEFVRDYWGRVTGNLTKRPSRGNPSNPLFSYLKRPLDTL